MLKSGEIYTIDDLVEIFPSKVKRLSVATIGVNIFGVIAQVEFIRLVSWKEEVIITLMNGQNSCVKVSFWKNEETPIFADTRDADKFKGKMALLKKVKVLAQEANEFGGSDFYAELMTDINRTILTLNIDAASLLNFYLVDEPFDVIQKLSFIPKHLQGKNSVKKFPIWEWDKSVVLQTFKIFILYNDATDLRYFGSRFNLWKFHFWNEMRNENGKLFVEKYNHGARLKNALKMATIRIGKCRNI